MTREELTAIESRMTKEQIMERARTLRPVGEFAKKGGMRFWLKADHIATVAYLWSPEVLRPTGFLKELGRVTTYHQYGHPSLFKPSVDECIYQCPYPEATAFMIVGNVSFDRDLDRHTATTVYFAGGIPRDILERLIEW